jgi:HSP20 family molecular chaperone IbpA
MARIVPAIEVSMSAVTQSPIGSFEKLALKKQAGSHCAAIALVPRRAGWQSESPPIEVAETQLEYKFIVPLSGIDPRKIYVFAMPRSILIEIHFKSMMHHKTATAGVMETIDQRIVREFNLPAEIEQGAATIRIYGESLLIAARKARRIQSTSWSQLLPVEARGAVMAGCSDVES